MTTNVTILSDALRLLGIVSETQPLSPEQGAVGLRRLNQMLEAWTENGIQLGYYEQTLTTATCPIPKWAEQGVTSKLAQSLQPLYPSSTLENWVWNDDQNGYGMILRKSVVEAMKPADLSHMPQGSGSYGSGYSILTDD